MNLNFTNHSLARIRQRGLTESDIQPILNAGTPVNADSILLLGRDVDREVRKLKKKISRLERLKGCRVVIGEEDNIITVYRPSRKIEKRLLRGTHRHKSTREESKNDNHIYS